MHKEFGLEPMLVEDSTANMLCILGLVGFAVPSTATMQAIIGYKTVNRYPPYPR